MLIDTHCHLDAAEFDADRDAIVRAARAAGVAQQILPAVDPANWSAVRACCVRYPECRPAYGMHPLYIGTIVDSALTLLRHRVAAELDGEQPPVAIGEIGLDYFHPGYDAERQEYFFLEQLKIARDFDLPVLLHVRRAVDPVLRCLRRIGVRRGIAHAFNGSRQQADAFLALGFRLGFGGAMTHAGSTRIRTLAAALPGEAIVLETDAPDIPPAWLSGGRNSPVELPRIAAVLADLRGVTVGEIALLTTQNARAVLRLEPISGTAK